MLCKAWLWVSIVVVSVVAVAIIIIVSQCNVIHRYDAIPCSISMRLKLLSSLSFTLCLNFVFSSIFFSSSALTRRFNGLHKSAAILLLFNFASIMLSLCYLCGSDNVLYCVIKKNIISWYAFEIRRVLQNRLDGIEIQDTSIEKIVDQSKFIAINIHLFLCYYNGLNYGFERK